VPGGWQDVGRMYWYNVIDLAYSAVTSRLPLILIVISMKMTFLDSFVDVHLSVGQNKIRHDKPTMNKRVGRTKCPRRG
jgi:hypothetical protein